MQGRVPVVVATNARDGRRQRRCAHHRALRLPGTVEASPGNRSGRSRRKAVRVVLFRDGDRRTQEFFIQMAHPPAILVRAVYDRLCAEQPGLVDARPDCIQRRAPPTGRRAGHERTVSCALPASARGWCVGFPSDRLTRVSPDRRPSGPMDFGHRLALASSRVQADPAQKTIEVGPWLPPSRARARPGSGRSAGAGAETTSSGAPRPAASS